VCIVRASPIFDNKSILVGILIWRLYFINQPGDYE
jgi:hypothetical protein